MAREELEKAIAATPRKFKGIIFLEMTSKYAKNV